MAIVFCMVAALERLVDRIDLHQKEFGEQFEKEDKFHINQMLSNLNKASHHFEYFKQWAMECMVVDDGVVGGVAAHDEYVNDGIDTLRVLLNWWNARWSTGNYVDLQLEYVAKTFVQGEPIIPINEIEAITKRPK